MHITRTFQTTTHICTWMDTHQSRSWSLCTAQCGSSGRRKESRPPQKRRYKPRSRRNWRRQSAKPWTIFSRAGSKQRRQSSYRTEPPFLFVHGRHTVRIYSTGDSPVISSPGIISPFGGRAGHTIQRKGNGFFVFPKHTPPPTARKNFGTILEHKYHRIMN